MRHYLNKRKERIRDCGFPLDDELLVAIDGAADAIELLNATLACVASRGTRGRRQRIDAAHVIDPTASTKTR
jgi:hypothetical protein